MILYLNKDYNINEYPNTKKWLSNFSSDLKKRREYKKGTIPWYSLQWPRIKEELNVKDKILLQRTRNERLVKRIVATIDETHNSAESLWNIIPKNEEYSIYFLLAILNSKLINYLFSTKFLNLGIKKDYLNKISFPKLNHEEQEHFIKLVKKMLNLHEKIKTASVPQPSLETEIITIKSKINEMIYELYNLTKDEIEIIENFLNKKKE